MRFVSESMKLWTSTVARVCDDPPEDVDLYGIPRAKVGNLMFSEACHFGWGVI